MIRAINFAVANHCSAVCIYCPADRGEDSEAQILPFDIFEKVLEEVSREDFKSQNDLQVIRLGENGDMFLNKSILDMFRMVRSKLPGVRIEMYNHFTKLKPEIATILLEERLLDAVFMNIDGVGENYWRVKHASYDTVMHNLAFFIKKRDALGLTVPVLVRALTIRKYIDTVRANFGVDPGHVAKEFLDSEDDFESIKEEVEKVLNQKQDGFKRGMVHMWGERDTLASFPFKSDGYACPMLYRIEHEAYISPDGDWYLCCLDSKQEVKVGNVKNRSLREIAEGSERKRILELLHNRRFDAVGGPCKTVHCCHVYHPIPLVSRVFRFLANFSYLAEKGYAKYKRYI